MKLKHFLDYIGLKVNTIEAGKEHEYLAKQKAEQEKLEKEHAKLLKERAEHELIEKEKLANEAKKPISIIWYGVLAVIVVALILTNLWFFVGVALLIALILYIIRALFKKDLKY